MGLTDEDKSLLREALHKGYVGGTSGALAMTIQVSSLMWMRTTMNYQYRFGTSTSEAMRALWKDGGIRRFYRGYGPALLQGPFSRFGDTAANVGILAVLESQPDLPIFVKTGVASVTAGTWRIVIMPLDTIKTTLQVEGKEAMGRLRNKVKTHGGLSLYHGSLAAAAATTVGHFPWFFTFNTLQAYIPVTDDPLKKLGRNALIGFTSSVVSDSISNSLRVVKTTRQTFPESISYANTIKHVVEKDGIMGLFGRGLKTRLLTNGIQGIMFSVLWKFFMDAKAKKEKEADECIGPQCDIREQTKHHH